MAKNLHVTVNSVDIAKRNLKKVTYPDISTSLKAVKRTIPPLSEAEYWKSETLLYSNGPTEESGSWTQAKAKYDRGQTFVFGNRMTTVENSNNNSFYGTLLYPANKILVSQNDTISIDVSSTNQSNVTLYIVDTNLARDRRWYMTCEVVFLTSVPGDFSDTFGSSSWEGTTGWSSEHFNTRLFRIGGKGNDTSNKVISNTRGGATVTYTAKCPISGSYYVCLCIGGYDAKTYNLALNNFKIT